MGIPGRIAPILILSLFAASARGQVGDTSFIRLLELPEKGEALELPATTTFHFVDINSSVKVKFVPSVLAGGTKGVIEAEKVKTLRKNAEQGVQFLSAVRDNLERYLHDVENLRTQLLRGAGGDMLSRFKEALKAHGRLTEAMLNYLESMGQRDAAEQALSEPDAAYSKVISLLEGTLTDLQAQVRQITEADSLLISVWCLQRTQGGEPVRIHVPGYDDLPSGNVDIVEKITFSRTDAEEKALRESLKLHESLKAIMLDIGDKTSDVRGAFDNLRTQFLEDLNELAGLFGVGDLQSSMNEIRAALKDSVRNPALGRLINEVNVLLSDPPGFKDLFNLKELNTKLVEELRKSEPSPLSFFSSLQTRLQQFAQLKNRLEAVATVARTQNLSNLLDGLSRMLEANMAAFSASVQGRIREFIDVKIGAWKASFAKIDLILQKYDVVSQFASQFGALKDCEHITNQFAARVEIPDISTTPLSDAPETYVEIPKTNRKEGDSYTLSVKVISGKNVRFLTEQNFVVRKFGWHNTWSASLLFAKYDAEAKFLPVTGVSWLLHHSAKSGGGTEILGNVLAMGFGFNSVLFSNSGNIEYGLGVTVGLFNDFLQVGYGVNMQRSSDKGYFFVGASLFDLLAQGKNEGASR